ncbi:YifB family Mg chelatase-like AAA ATPase [Candidatus Peribacteria bacterium]|nr:YifB family Mg chelatase-like AAA ATPase [Candidatus Peribacteria bacterium]
MLARLTSFATVGIAARKIDVEIAAPPGDGKMVIVGLGDTAVKESEQRVRLALRSSGCRFPTGRRITVNLAPANLRKAGPHYDLPIAVGLLLVTGALDIPPERLESTALLGELALDGSLRHIAGVLPAAIACRNLGIQTLVVPAVDAAEGALIEGIKVIGACNLQELMEILSGAQSPRTIASKACIALPIVETDFGDIRGQHGAKRALEIAAAGGHNVLLSGAPGTGKTLLARALRGILPPMSTEESIEVTRIYSVANMLPEDAPLVAQRPFRVVHHTASAVSIVGGGQMPGPGEISLAHRGVLFLDELAEFPPAVLDVLRQPLEDRTITITRAQGSVTFPADFTLVAAMNPPDTDRSHPRRRPGISAPLLDRIDLTIPVDPVDIADLQKKPQLDAEASESIRHRVIGALQRQQARFSGQSTRTNAGMGVREIDALCPLREDPAALLRRAAEKLKLSARAYHRTIKVARTIADLAGSEEIATQHVAEALQYRGGGEDV